MTKFLLTKPGGPWDFPALGFSAINGAILDGALSSPAITSTPGPEWSVYVGGSAETGITRYAPPATTPTYTEPQDGYVLRYSDTANAYVPQSVETAIAPAVEAAIAPAIAEAREVADGLAGLDGAGKLYEARIPDRLGSTQLGLTYARTSNRPVNLKDNAAIDFTGATDTSTALQAALNAAGPGTPVELGRSGVLTCHSGITLAANQFQTLTGPGNYQGAGGTGPAEIRFPTLTGSQVGITGGVNNVISNLIIRGPMTGADSTVGYNSPSSSPMFNGVSFTGWAIGAQIAGAYYTRFLNCEWRRNKNALVNVGSGGSGNFDLIVEASRFFCKYGTSDGNSGAGIVGAARGLVVRDTAIEGYGASGAISMTSQQALRLDGVYFESGNTDSNAFGIVAAGLDKITLDITGSTVYLTHHNRWVHVGNSTNVIIESRGNHFVCPTTSATTPTAYFMNAADVTNIRGRLGYDNWSEVTKVGAAYVPNGVFQLGQIPNLEIRDPQRSYLGGDIYGSGSPEGVVPGPVGAKYRRSNGGAGTTLYVKESGTGTTGWVAK